MKKIILAIASILILAGCSGAKEKAEEAKNEVVETKNEVVDKAEEAGVKKTVSGFFKKLNDKDIEGARKELADENLKSLIDPNDTGSTASEKLSVNPELLAKFTGFKEEITNVNINGDQATANVKLVGYDNTGIINSLIAEYAKKSVKGEKVTQQEAEKFIKEKLDEKQKAKDYAFLVKLKKVDSEWKIIGNKENKEMFNAISGGLLDKSQKILNIIS